MKKAFIALENDIERELNYKNLITRDYTINNVIDLDNAIPILQTHYDIEKEIPSLVRDDVFKIIMLNEKRKSFPCKFLSILLDMDYEDLLENLEFRKNELDRYNIKSKKRTVDFAGKYKDTIFSIEMNNTNTLERNIDYANQLAGEKIVRGSSEYHLYNVIQINLNNFKFVGHDEVFEIYKMQDTIGNRYYLQSFVNVSLLNLREKFYNKGIESLSRKERFILAITETNRSQIKKLVEGDKEAMKFIKEMINVITKRRVLYAYDHQKEDIEAFKMQNYAIGKKDGRLEGIEQGKIEGIEQGKEEEQNSIILNMFKKIQDINKIHEFTGIPKNKIKSVLNIL